MSQTPKLSVVATSRNDDHGGNLLPRTQWGHFGPLEQPEQVGEQIVSALERAQPSATPAQG